MLGLVAHVLEDDERAGRTECRPALVVGMTRLLFVVVACGGIHRVFSKFREARVSGFLLR